MHYTVAIVIFFFSLLLMKKMTKVIFGYLSLDELCVNTNSLIVILSKIKPALSHSYYMVEIFLFLN